MFHIYFIIYIPSELLTEMIGDVLLKTTVLPTPLTITTNHV